MGEINIVTLEALEPGVVGLVDKKRRGYRIIDLGPGKVVGLHKAFLEDAVLVYATDKMNLVAALTKMFPDYRCLE